MGASLNSDFEIIQHAEAPISVMKTPWQHLGPLIEDAAYRARFRRVCKDRSILEGAGEIDRELFNDAVKRLPCEDAKWLKAITNLSRWTDAKIAGFSNENDGKCGHRGHVNGDLYHMLWICPKLEDARYEGDAELKDFNINNLPASLKIGLPPAMTANDTDWLWDGDESDISKHPP